MKLEIVFEDGRKEIFDSVESFNVTDKQTANEGCNTPEIAQIPSEGKFFEINPLEIYRSKFEKPMKDQNQEVTRQLILEAFAEVDKHPEKYASTFYTLTPKKNWEKPKTFAELKKYANDLGGMMANWVDQALEWAQRISNGESWETICNDQDTANWYRLVIWKNEYARLIGGSHYYKDEIPASSVGIEDFDYDDAILYTVPLVVIKKK